MNRGLIVKILGILVLIEGVFMLPSTVYSGITNDGAFNSFLLTLTVLSIAGITAYFFIDTKSTITPKDGIAIVTCGWIVVSLFGALPLYLSASVPTYIDGFFEIVSGFTTTGASVIGDISIVPKSVVLWRSTTHWIGGMGILVFTLSLLPRLGVGGFQIFKAESPGPIAGKIDPKMSQTAKRLYSIYLVITLILFVLLLLGGMSAFDSIIHTFGVVGTGGFSSKVDSVGHFKGNYIPLVMSVFMMICGTNFTMHYYLYKKKLSSIYKDEELKAFYFIIFTAILIITINLFQNGFGTLEDVIVKAIFQVTSIASTSGFANADFDMWPAASKFVLLILYFFGSCAGSTAGGIKIIRILILYKTIKREIVKVIHPKAVIPIKINGKIINEEIVMGIFAFLGIYMAIFLGASLLVTLSGMDILTSISSVATMLSNVGPGFAMVGPTKTFEFYSSGYKLMFSLLMLLGRLEFFTIIALIMPKQSIRGDF
ncbi:trk system potassium uptake protein TrkH [Peptoniphilus asaccharolyticus DSM 20463]|uniref:Trk system potassium uptake protein TrkH n=1 Tax=Peptoniphilus asaccharolyticus DSM 20463 TaxID=573058 RepID=A0A1W1VKK8_PEPAS|nr:TrkH family potassium uptake protein [Peptoniphilus asaccharolyticus]MBL7574460.1 TrkH family potassium uptake protein [Peptoniphilus asaccharolyticus]SMB93836.1 trk system potassium uptake protein TrkH [Peptoniphilus asaccharolyticus DSM 20463]